MKHLLSPLVPSPFFLILITPCAIFFLQVARTLIYKTTDVLVHQLWQEVFLHISTAFSFCQDRHHLSRYGQPGPQGTARTVGNGTEEDKCLSWCILVRLHATMTVPQNVMLATSNAKNFTQDGLMKEDLSNLNIVSTILLFCQLYSTLTFSFQCGNGVTEKGKQVAKSCRRELCC